MKALALVGAWGLMNIHRVFAASIDWHCHGGYLHYICDLTVCSIADPRLFLFGLIDLSRKSGSLATILYPVAMQRGHGVSASFDPSCHQSRDVMHLPAAKSPKIWRNCFW